MKKAFVFLITILLFLANTIPVYAELPAIDSDAYILIDAKTGQVLSEQNADTALYPASTTKIMTAVLALEKGNMDQMMTASAAAVYDIGKDGMNIGIMPGEQLRLGDLLNALLVRSANETANIIAENLCENRSDFVSLMNERAHELGATNTNFVNPCGSHDSQHYTTARDLARIAQYAMTIPDFRDIVKKTKYSMSPTNKHSEWDTVLYTTNHLLRNSSGNEAFHITGIKTGFTVPAGYNLISSAENDSGVSLIAVVMGVRNNNASNLVYNYSEKLLEYGFNNYSIQNIVEKEQIIRKNIQVTDAKDDSTVNLVAENGLEALLPIDKDKWSLRVDMHIDEAIQAPVKKNDILGYMEYSNDGFALGKVNIIAENSVDKSFGASLKDTIKSVWNNETFRKVLLITGIIVIGLFVLRLILRRISRKTRSKKHYR